MALTKAFHWQQEDYFPYLLKNVKKAVIALEYLVDDIHEDKDKTVEQILRHGESDKLIYGLISLMSSDNLRVSGNSAYVFGTIAENDYGIDRIMAILNKENSTLQNPESDNFLLYLVNLLRSTDYECLMNAAGTIGTISESNSGRDWLILQPLLDDVIELCTMLLDNLNIWVSSNAALVIARISIEEAGCARILAHHMAQTIFTKLITSLGSDNAGRGMNCAFAIGRICDNEERRMEMLRSVNSKSLVESLARMIEANSDNGCTKNACFALSSLASSKETHSVVVDHSSFDNLLNHLCDLLLVNNDAETQWFAAMLMRIFSSYPVGCIRMKNVDSIWDTLSDLNKSKKVFSEVKEEIGTILDSLKPLEKSDPIRATVKGSTEVLCEWNELKAKANFNVLYLLYKDNVQVYQGPDLAYTVKHLRPFTEYSFKVQSLVTDNNELSEFSEAVDVTTDESIPMEPINLRATGQTMALIKVQWDPPAQMNGIIKGYYIFKDNAYVDQTFDQMYIFTGLPAETKCEVAVCASTSKGKGPRAILQTTTLGLGETLPDKPTFSQIGRKELTVKWQPPQVITGKLNRYELLMNGKSVYSGLAEYTQIQMLKPDTEYKFEIVAYTSEGKRKSKIAKIFTLKDETSDSRSPLYQRDNNNSNNSNNKADSKDDKSTDNTTNQHNQRRNKSPTDNQSPSRNARDRNSKNMVEKEPTKADKAKNQKETRHSPDRKNNPERNPLYPNKSDNPPAVKPRQGSRVGTAKSPDRSPTRTVANGSPERNSSQMTDKPVMLQRHKSTLHQKTKNFNRRTDSVIKEETQNFNDINGSQTGSQNGFNTGYGAAGGLPNSQSVSNQNFQYGKLGNGKANGNLQNSMIRESSDLANRSLSSFLPPVGKNGIANDSNGEANLCRSTSMYFEGDNASTTSSVNLSSFRSLKREKELAHEQTKQLTTKSIDGNMLMNGFKNGGPSSSSQKNKERLMSYNQKGASMSNLNESVQYSSNNIDRSQKNVNFSTVTLNLKELTPSFPAIGNRNISQQGFSSNRTLTRTFDRSPSRSERTYEQTAASSKDLRYDRIPDAKEAPLMNILKRLHKDRVPNGGDDMAAVSNQLMNSSIPLNDMKFSFLSQFPKQ